MCPDVSSYVIGDGIAERLRFVAQHPRRIANVGLPGKLPPGTATASTTAPDLHVIEIVLG
jgi:hypothetical protein